MTMTMEVAFGNSRKILKAHGPRAVIIYATWVQLKYGGPGTPEDYLSYAQDPVAHYKKCFRHHHHGPLWPALIVPGVIAMAIIKSIYESIVS